jgi:hypothetical protein
LSKSVVESGKELNRSILRHKILDLNFKKETAIITMQNGNKLGRNL